jgi:class 3 adenylate cyclase
MSARGFPVSRRLRGNGGGLVTTLVLASVSPTDLRCGTIGFEGRFDYAAIGTVSNVASRLCDEAKPSQILIRPRVLMAVEDAVKVEPVGEFELKGIRRPIAAYNVLAIASANA